MKLLALRLGCLAGLACLPLAQGRALPHGPLGEPPLFAPVHQLLPDNWDLHDVDVFDLASGDLDGDGDLDAILQLGVLTDGFGSYHWANTVYVNNGHGLFSEIFDMPFGPDAAADVALAELDGDGDLDLLLPQDTDLQPGTDHLYLNDGRAGFSDASAGLAPVAGDPKTARFGDLEGDGDLDLLYVWTRNGPSTKPVLHANDGAAAFTDLTASLPAGSDFFDARFGDVDGDDDVDLVLGARVLWENDGLGGLSDVTATQMPGGNGALHFRLADLDGDGDLDAGAFGLMLVNDGTGTFTLRTIPSGGSGGQPVAAIDTEGDGDLDLFGPKILLVNDGSAHFSGAVVPWESEYFTGFEAGDFDADGDPDALVMEEGEYLGVLPRRAEYLLLNDGANGFTDSRTLVLDSALETAGPARLGRVDGDPHLDLVAPAFIGAGLELRLGDGAGAFGEPLDLFLSALDLELADIDGDEDTDMVLGTAAGVRLLENLVFSFSQKGTPVTSQTRLVELADVDGDLDLDVATAESATPWNRLLLNDGSGVFSLATSARFPGLGGMPTAIAFLDIEQDGDLDVAFALAGVKLYQNDGTDGFADVTGTHVPGGSAQELAAGDVDGDGDPDLLVGTGNGLRLLQNDGSGTFSERPQPVPELDDSVPDPRIPQRLPRGRPRRHRRRRRSGLRSRGVRGRMANAKLDVASGAQPHPPRHLVQPAADRSRALARSARPRA